MPMSKTQPMASRKEISGSLKKRAAELWGGDRAESLEPIIQETAGHIWLISQNLPAPEEEPGFYF